MVSALMGFGAIGVLAGCNKNLDRQPDTILNNINTFDDLRSALRGSYNGFKANGYYNAPAASGTGSGWSATPELMGDDFVEALESLGNWNQLSEMIYAADNGQVDEIYFSAYQVITRANDVLQTVPTYETGSTNAEAKRIRAQALAIRAHAHFDLMRYFALSFDRNSTALGVPYVTTFDPQNPFANLPRRGTVQQNYDAIYNDLNEALVSFRAGGNTTGNSARYFIDSATVYAIRTRVSYYASQWADVVRDANVVLTLRPLGNATDFVNSFLAANETAPPSEIIWQIPSDNALRPGGAISGANTNYRVSAAMSAILQSQGGAYVNTNITRFNQAGVGGVQRTLLWKYPGIRSFKVYRAGEMMLMRAEARYRLNANDPAALTDLNTLRTNRGVAVGTETGTALLNAILLQRRVELLGEGHRWFDIRRTTRTIVRQECGTAGGSRATNCTINSSSRSWNFPIPFNERRVNTNLEQNPGY
jgi:hypothetical protein